jgi:hypothetical protein
MHQDIALKSQSIMAGSPHIARGVRLRAERDIDLHAGGEGKACEMDLAVVTDDGGGFEGLHDRGLRE